MSRPSPETKAAAVADYLATRDPYAAVAARHGVSRSVLHSWVNGGPSKRRAKTWGADELALTGGRWVVVRGVQRWEKAA